jgi:hypothetical protein
MSKKHPQKPTAQQKRDEASFLAGHHGRLAEENRSAPLAIGAGPTKCPDCARREAAGHCPACHGVENGIPRLRSLALNSLIGLVRQGEINSRGSGPGEDSGLYVVKLGDYVIARVLDPQLVTIELLDAPASEGSSTRLPISGVMETLAALEVICKRLLHFFWTGEQKS